MSFSQVQLPSRPLTIKRNPLAHGTWYVVAFLILAGLAGALFVWQAPGLIRDFQISQNPLTLRNGDVRGGNCTTRRGITDCEAELVYSYNGVDYDSFVSMAFIDIHAGDYTVDLVISRDKPELATLSLGIDMLWNRIIVFLIFFVLMAIGALTLLVKAFQIRSSNGRLRYAGVMTAVPVEITQVRKDAAGWLISYIDVLKGPKSRRTTIGRFARSETPLVVRDEAGNARGVAVKHADAALPVLLDRDLRRLDLTEEERQAALGALEGNILEMDTATVAKASAPKRAPFRPMVLIRFVLVAVILVVAAVAAYWIYYVTSADSQFDDIGMEINAVLPGPLNEWGCDQLEKRFGDDRAPYGCAADDFTSWK